VVHQGDYVSRRFPKPPAVKPVLPVNWIEEFDAEGTPYYYNVVTLEARWLPPVVSKPPLTPKPQLPIGWKRLQTELGAVYYLNESTNETTWIHPSYSESPNKRPRLQ